MACAGPSSVWSSRTPDFNLAVLTRACGSWQVGIELLAVLALDLELKERVQVLCDKLARENTGNDRYLGGGPYLIGRDIAHVKLSCSKEVTEKHKNWSSRGLEKVSFFWKESNTSRIVLVVYEFWSTANTFFEDSPASFEAVFGYTSEIMTRAFEYGFDAYAEPHELPMDNEYLKAFLEISQQAVNFYGATCVLSNLIGTKMLSIFPDC